MKVNVTYKEKKHECTFIKQWKQPPPNALSPPFCWTFARNYAGQLFDQITAFLNSEIIINYN